MHQAEVEVMDMVMFRKDNVFHYFHASLEKVKLK